MDFITLTNAMNNHALQEYPRECVGIITKSFTYVPCRNISDNPKFTFFLDPADLVKHDGNIWGIFHSHPGSDNPLPSSEDKLSAAFNEYKFVVGFNNKFYLYWYAKNVDALKFEKFEETHLVSDNKTTL